MLNESVTIKEMNATEQGTDVHENNVEGAQKVMLCTEKSPYCEEEPKEFSAAGEQLDRNSAANVIQGGQSLSKNPKLAVELGIVVNVVIVLEA